MTIGLVLLCVVAIMIFFGLAQGFFKRMGLASWLAFVLTLALIVGILIPDIAIGTGFSFNIGGFIIPVVITVILGIMIGWGWELFRAFIAMLSVAAVAVATRMLIMPDNGGLILTASLIVGLVGGTVAYLIGQTRLSTIASIMGGIVLADVIVNLLYVYSIGGYEFSMGTRGVFDAIAIGSVFGIILLEAVNVARRAVSDRKLSGATTESGDDFPYPDDSYEDFFDDTVV